MDDQRHEHPDDIPGMISGIESYGRDLEGCDQAEIGRQLIDLAAKLRRATRKLHFVDEERATEISNRSRAWLRARFDEWAAAGGALLSEGKHYYRECVLPRRIPDPRNAGRYPRRTP
ncbi:MAG: hypothetical protein R3B35_02800 [Gemmatimonadales bacterium]